MEDRPDQKEDVVKFLLGEGTLDGVNYGERPGSKPMFWWRTAVREKFESLQKEIEEKDKEISHFKVEKEEADDVIISLKKEILEKDKEIERLKALLETHKYCR